VVVVVTTADVAAVAVEVIAVVTVVVDVVEVDVVVGDEIDAVVDVAQDAKTSDATIRQVSSIQTIPLFI